MLKYKLYYYAGKGELKKCGETLSESYSNSKDAYDKMVGLVGSYPMYRQICIIEFWYDDEGNEIRSQMVEWAEVNDDEVNDDEE